MTRQELTDTLTDWTPPERWDAATIKRRDDLQFALWWYCASTDFGKANPSWPSADYVESKTGSGPPYLNSVDAALSLIPDPFNWIVGKGRTRPDEPPYGVQILLTDGAADDVIAEAESASAPIAICIAALRARG
jgi:hypothetical protein